MGSRGKGSEGRDWKGLVWCVSEEEKRAEKNKGQESEDEPIRGVVSGMLGMERGEYFVN